MRRPQIDDRQQQNPAYSPPAPPARAGVCVTTPRWTRRPARRHGVLLGLLLLLVPVAAGPALAAPDTPSAVVSPGAELPGFDVPLGHFFPLGLPSDPQAGFAVDDGGGAKLWSEYQRLDGGHALGLPSSRRYRWQDALVQHFQAGVLRWDPQARAAEILPLEQVGNPPPEAVQLAPAPVLEGEAGRPPWSGWWWPATTR